MDTLEQTESKTARKARIDQLLPDNLLACECNLGECRTKLLPLLSEVSAVVCQGGDLHSTLNIVLQLMQRHMQVVRGMVTLHDPSSGHIYVHEGVGLTADEIARGIYHLGEGITGRVVETAKPVIVPSIADEPGFLNRTGSWRQDSEKNQAFICVPILRANKVMGTISIERHYNNPKLLNLDVEILAILATVIAQVVELHLIESVHKSALLDENRRLRDALKEKFKPSNMIGNSRVMRDVYQLIDKVSRSRSTVLILGESGVGKELIASAIHYNSPQFNGPFIKFNCASLPESVIESELFGHEKGSFTGATNRRIGRFEDANGGTIFLDEVGELSLAMQAKLLRVLQERTFERLGSNTAIQVDLRILAATNRNLSDMVAKGEFREDLFYRLNVFPIVIPPLRERAGDIILLAEHFVNHYAEEQGITPPKLTTPALNLLQAYSWPGNVRELENTMERALILAEDGMIHTYDLPAQLQTVTAGVSESPANSRISQVEYELIVEALGKCHGNISHAAQQLGMTRRILSLRMAKYQLHYKQFRA